ncbi:MAG: VOC family protein [Candidatus Micrarchaeaceae archaeon]
MITKTYSIAVVVKNKDEAKKWYVEKLGFRVVDDDGHWVTVAPKSARSRDVLIHLCESYDENAEEPGGNTGIAFMTDSVEESFKELKAKGVEFSKEPSDEGFGKYAIFKDLYGNEFWLFE